MFRRRRSMFLGKETNASDKNNYEYDILEGSPFIGLQFFRQDPLPGTA